MNISGNLKSGQVSGDMAKHLWVRFGIQQDRMAFSLNRSDTSISKSVQLELAVTASRIASLSSGKFFGLVANDRGEPIELKAFHDRIVDDHKAIQAQTSAYKPIPVVWQISPHMVGIVSDQIHQKAHEITDHLIAFIKSDRAFEHLFVAKKKCGRAYQPIFFARFSAMTVNSLRSVWSILPSLMGKRAINCSLALRDIQHH